MTRPRFQARGVERRGGRPVVRVFDQVLDEEIMVYRRGRSYLRWEANDLLVRNQGLQRVVRETLDAELVA